MDYFYFLSSESYFLKYKASFRVSVSWNKKDFFRVFISWNIRTAFFWENIRNFSGCIFFLFFELGLKSSISQNTRSSFRDSVCWNIRIFFWVSVSRNIRKYKKFSNTTARKFHLLKYKESFWGCIFFYFSSVDWKVPQVALSITYNEISRVVLF